MIISFLSFPIVWWCKLPIFPSICTLPFLRAFWFLLDLVVRLLPSCVVCRFSLLASRIFLCKIPLLYLEYIFSKSVLGFPILFRFWQTVWCRPCTSGGWFFSAIYWVCIRQCISWGCDWVVSSLLQIVVVILYLPGICLFGSLPLLNFSHQLSIPLSRFACSSR